MTACSSAYIGFLPDGYPSQLTANIGSYPDGYLLEILLKDGGSPTMIAGSLAYIVFSP